MAYFGSENRPVMDEAAQQPTFSEVSPIAQETPAAMAREEASEAEAPRRRLDNGSLFRRISSIMSATEASPSPVVEAMAAEQPESPEASELTETAASETEMAENTAVDAITELNDPISEIPTNNETFPEEIPNVTLEDAPSESPEAMTAIPETQQLGSEMPVSEESQPAETEEVTAETSPEETTEQDPEINLDDAAADQEPLETDSSERTSYLDSDVVLPVVADIGANGLPIPPEAPVMTPEEADEVLDAEQERMQQYLQEEFDTEERVEQTRAAIENYREAVRQEEAKAAGQEAAPAEMPVEAGEQTMRDAAPAIYDARTGEQIGGGNLEPEKSQIVLEKENVPAAEGEDDIELSPDSDHENDTPQNTDTEPEFTDDRLEDEDFAGESELSEKTTSEFSEYEDQENDEESQNFENLNIDFEQNQETVAEEENLLETSETENLDAEAELADIEATLAAAQEHRDEQIEVLSVADQEKRAALNESLVNSRLLERRLAVAEKAVVSLNVLNEFARIDRELRQRHAELLALQARIEEQAG